MATVAWVVADFIDRKRSESDVVVLMAVLKLY